MSVPALTTYAALRDKVRQTLLLGQQKIEQARVQTYWQTGLHIHEHILCHKERAEYGKEVILRLAEDLEVGDELLYRCLRFAESFPISSARRKLSWAHYRALMRVGDEKKRLELENRAAKDGWVSRDLEIKIRNLNWESRAVASSGKPPSLLAVPASGPFYTYPIIRPESIHKEVPGLALDNGFSMTTDLQDRFPSCRYPEGTIVTSVKRSKGKYSLSVARCALSALYTYKAYVKKVIDGDTLKVSFDAGFGEKRGETIRLRGIDCPEINTPEGMAAKRFVERELAPCEFITVKSTRSSRKEKWGRYLGDVFYIPARSLKASAMQSAVSSPQSDMIYLNNLLLEKGHAVRVRD